MLAIFGVTGLPEIEPDADLARLIAEHGDLADGDVVVVTSKIVSKAEGRTIELDAVTPSAFAVEWASRWEKDPRVVEVVLRESTRIVRQIGPVLITETRHGFVCANAGVDQSSSGAHDRVVVLPDDPDRSARRMRDGSPSWGSTWR
jgi:coenzyme F420-0:L-glutamate ligase / coenzyme F420-1:gamma-L-glutamate ligase